MIPRKTVLILGAGASHPYGYPLGTQLTKMCWSDRSARESFIGENAEPGNNWNKIISEFQTKLRGSQTDSIDALLERKQFKQWQQAGKIIIAKIIYSKELETRKMILENIGDHWYKYLRHLLFNNVEEEDFTNNKLTIVTFNYDRSIEYFLSNAYVNTYNLIDKSFDNLKKVFDIIPVIHIYGTLGELYNSKSIIPEYGTSNINGSDLVNIANNLKIWNEEETNPQIEQAREAILNAENVFTIGYGFHAQNNLRLGLNRLSNYRTIASYYNVTDPEMSFHKRTMKFDQYCELGGKYLITDHFRETLFEHITN